MESAIASETASIADLAFLAWQGEKTAGGVWGSVLTKDAREESSSGYENPGSTPVFEPQGQFT